MRDDDGEWNWTEMSYGEEENKVWEVEGKKKKKKYIGHNEDEKKEEKWGEKEWLDEGKMRKLENEWRDMRK